jgi:hypothetical protein
LSARAGARFPPAPAPVLKGRAVGRVGLGGQFGRLLFEPHDLFDRMAMARRAVCDEGEGTACAAWAIS